MVYSLRRAATVGIFLFSSTLAAAELRVPQQYATIQAALDAARRGDTVLVAPGSYRENITIVKSVHLRASGGAAKTVIDGGRAGKVIDVRGTGSEKVTISGFTITNGFHAGSFQSGGIYAANVVAAITENVIQDNIGCLGPGISTTQAAVTIQRNRISNNVQDAGCFGADGGGLFLNVDGSAATLVANNIISGHRIGGRGAGIHVNAMNNVVVRDNLIIGNQAPTGGGIMMNIASGIVSGNVLFDNSADYGGAMALFPVDNDNRLVVWSNVMGGNHAAAYGSAVQIVTVNDYGLQMIGNVIDGDTTASLIRCDGVEFTVAPSNSLRNSAGPELDGNCVSSFTTP